jgi:hypothetical protein
METRKTTVVLVSRVAGVRGGKNTIKVATRGRGISSSLPIVLEVNVKHKFDTRETGRFCTIEVGINFVHLSRNN